MSKVHQHGNLASHQSGDDYSFGCVGDYGRGSWTRPHLTDSGDTAFPNCSLGFVIASGAFSEMDRELAKVRFKTGHAQAPYWNLVALRNKHYDYEERKSAGHTFGPRKPKLPQVEENPRRGIVGFLRAKSRTPKTPKTPKTPHLGCILPGCDGREPWASDFRALSNNAWRHKSKRHFLFPMKVAQQIQMAIERRGFWRTGVGQWQNSANDFFFFKQHTPSPGTHTWLWVTGGHGFNKGPK